MTDMIATTGWRDECLVILVSRLNLCMHRKDPSPVPLRLDRTPERDTLSPRERAAHSLLTPGVQPQMLDIPSLPRGGELFSWQSLMPAS
jgi:hypothetical protein